MNKEIKTLKDLITDESFVNYIVEDIEDIPEDVTVSYEVWAIGYDGKKAITDTEFLLKELADPDEAVAFAEACTLADILNMSEEEPWEATLEDYEVTSLTIQVETVVNDAEEGTMNVGTIYHKTIQIDPADIHVTSKDYSLSDEGNLEISCELLKAFNKNDFIKVMFDDEDNNPILTYKIISKTTNNNYICEFYY
jgi:hypothetical protein